MDLDLVRMLVERQLRGKFLIRRSAGTRCVVTFPYPTPETPADADAA